jgi:hypothetical protein
LHNDHKQAAGERVNEATAFACSGSLTAQHEHIATGSFFTPTTLWAFLGRAISKL